MSRFPAQLSWRQAFLLGALFLVLPYLGAVLEGRTVVSDDSAHFESPMLTDRLRSAGEAWYPWTNGGMPAACYTIGRLGYWPQAAFLLLSPVRGVLFYYLLHVVAAYGGALLYLRWRHFSVLAAMLGALAYAGSAAICHYAVNAVFFPILTFAPLWLYFAERVIVRPRPGSILGLSLVASTIFNGSGWQMTVIFFACFAVHLLCWITRSRARRRKAARGLLCIAAAHALAVLQFLPEAARLSDSYAEGVVRAVRFSPALSGSVGLLETIGPHAFFSPFYGPLLECQELAAREYTLTLSAPFVPLALLAWWGRRARRSLLIPWVGLILVLGFLAIGYRNPVYRQLQDMVSFLAQFRAPLRYISPFPLLAMLAVATGTEALLRWRPPFASSLRRGALLWGLAGGAYYSLYLALGRPSWTAAHALLVASLAIPLVYLGSARWRRAALLVAAVLQVGASPLFVNSLFFMDDRVICQEIDLLETLGKQLPNPLTSIFYGLNPESPALVPVRTVTGLHPFMLRRWAEYLFVALHRREMTDTEYQRNLWMSFHPLTMLRDFEPPPRWEDPMWAMLGLGFVVLENEVRPVPIRLPGFWLARSARREDDRVRVRAELARPEYNPTETIYVEQALPEPPAPHRSGGIRLAHFAPSRIDFELRGASGWLVVNQDPFRGWTARLDGKEVALYRANTIFSAVPIASTNQRLELSYAPDGRGWWGPPLAVLCWLGLALAGLRARSGGGVRPSQPHGVPL